MWLKVVVPLLAVAYVAYRGVLALEIARARRAGDTARVAHLRTHGFGLYRWMMIVAVSLVVLLSLFLLLETHRA
jgi:hypothetical protein